MMIPRRASTPRAVLASLLLSLLLAGCGGGGGGEGSGAASGDAGAGAGTGGGGGSVPAGTVTLAVTPSLGQVFSGTVRVIAPGGGGEEVSELARARTREDGKAELEVPADAEGPFIVEVAGGEDATYYDEGSDSTVPLGHNDVLRAVVDDLPAGGLGVTPLTELAVRYLEARHGSLAILTRTQLQALFDNGDVAAAYARVRDELAPELGAASVLAVPAVVGSAGDLAALGTATGDLYALKLAALARVARLNAASPRPALAMLEDLARDFSDGAVDGMHGEEALAPASFQLETLAPQLREAARELAARDELKALVNTAEHYVSAFLAGLAAAGDDSGGDSGAGGDSGGGADAGSGDSGLPPPGDLLASWVGNYHGSWQVERLEAWVKVPTLSYPFYKWVRDPVSEEAVRLSMLALTFGDTGCHWTVNAADLQFGGLSIPFAATFAAAAQGEARRYVLPVSLTVLSLGVNGTTTLDTQGVLPTRIALDYYYKGLLKELRYTGACTFSYKG